MSSTASQEFFDKTPGEDTVHLIGRAKNFICDIEDRSTIAAALMYSSHQQMLDRFRTIEVFQRGQKVPSSRSLVQLAACGFSNGLYGLAIGNSAITSSRRRQISDIKERRHGLRNHLRLATLVAIEFRGFANCLRKNITRTCDYSDQRNPCNQG